MRATSNSCNEIPPARRHSPALCGAWLEALAEEQHRFAQASKKLSKFVRSVLLVQFGQADLFKKLWGEELESMKQACEHLRRPSLSTRCDSEDAEPGSGVGRLRNIDIDNSFNWQTLRQSQNCIPRYIFFPRKKGPLGTIRFCQLYCSGRVLVRFPPTSQPS